MDLFKYNFAIDLNIEYAHTKLIRLVGTHKKVLEYGCATGYMSKVLKEQFACEVTGIELNREAAEKAKEFCSQVIVGDVENLDLSGLLEPNSFDVIIFADVLEHLSEPWTVLEKVARFLKNNGYVLASIPNIAHASVIVELLNGKFDYKPLGLLDDTHLRFFTKESICRLFEKCGYVIGLIDRVTIPPQQTEFKTNMESIPGEVSDYMYRSNKEVETYQFIVKAFSAAVTCYIKPL